MHRATYANNGTTTKAIPAITKLIFRSVDRACIEVIQLVENVKETRQQ